MFAAPPADTPRTKARKWLNGDAVSPPAKAKARSSHINSTLKTGASSIAAGKAVRANGKAGATFWQDVDLSRQDEPSNDIGQAQWTDLGDSIAQDEAESDFLAPSPVKANNKGKGKGKQRQMDSLPSMELPNPKPSFFAPTAVLPMRKAAEKTADLSQYAPGPSKPKKRTIVAAALVPFDNIGEPDDNQLHVPPQLPKARSASPDEETASKRPRRAAQTSGSDGKIAGAGTGSQLASEQTGANLDAPLDNTTADSAAAEGNATDADAEEADDGYELRDMDEYEPYDPHGRRSATPAAGPEARAKRSASVQPDLDPNLVSLLSLKTSPVKHRLAKLHKKRDTTVQKLLQEPTYLIAQKKALATQGLEDLDDDQYLARTNAVTDDNVDDVSEGEPRSEDEQQERLAENSDDDWASEPDGWKDLGDGEMDYDDL